MNSVRQRSVLSIYLKSYLNTYLNRCVISEVSETVVADYVEKVKN